MPRKTISRMARWARVSVRFNEAAAHAAENLGRVDVARGRGLELQ